MLELKNDTLVFSFMNVHTDAKLSIDLQRTLRIPDDGRAYPLPPGKGKFPLRHVEDFKAKLPPSWTEHGGVFLPMYQSEAMWIQFIPEHNNERGCAYPFAVKVSTGKISALNGASWVSGLRHKDYCVIPDQKWIDGYVVENGQIRQFVAAPMGSGVSVEQQVTGKDEHGGIQIEVFPMKKEVYEARFPKRDFSMLRQRRIGANYKKGSNMDSWHGSGITTKSLGARFSSNSIGSSYTANSGPLGPMGPEGFSGAEGAYEINEMSVQSMSMAMGGRMAQQIFEDKFGIDAWDMSNSSRCFIHLTNSMVWRAITGSEPPTVPMTSAEYASHGMPWYDYYQETGSIGPSSTLQNVKSVAQVKPELLPENQQVNIPLSKVQVISGLPTPNKVKEGTW